MALHNFSTKLIKEVFRGMGGLSLLGKQKENSEKELSHARILKEKLAQDLDSKLIQILQSKPSNAEELKRHLSILNYENLQSGLAKLTEMNESHQGILDGWQELYNFIKNVSLPVYRENEFTDFWLRHNYSVYPDYQLDIAGLESSKIDFFATSSNRKNVFFILVELNRNAPETNVLKLYYYLKNSKAFWDYEHINIVQLFSPKYLVERKGKSLALARDLAIFLGSEFNGSYSFGERKIQLGYTSHVFGQDQYEIYSVFWKLLADEADEETRYKLMCSNLPTNKNFLSMCQKYAEREETRGGKVSPYIQNLVSGKGTPEDINSIFRSWCDEMIQTIEKSFEKQQLRL